MKYLIFAACLCLMTAGVIASDGIIVQLRTQPGRAPATQPANAAPEMSLEILAYPDKDFSSSLTTPAGSYQAKGVLHDLRQNGLYRAKLSFNLASMGASTDFR